MQHAVRLGQELSWEHDRHQRRTRGRSEGSCCAVKERHGIDDPDVTAIVDEKERQDDKRLGRVDPDQQWASSQSVDHEARERREE